MEEKLESKSKFSVEVNDTELIISVYATVSAVRKIAYFILILSSVAFSWNVDAILHWFFGL